MHRTIFGLAVLVAFTAVDLVAQYPGQYPPGGYPPGGYPPGGYPDDRYPSGPGIPFPRRKKKTTAGKEAAEQLQQISGIFRQINDKSILMTADDSRTLDIRRSGDTKFTKDNKEIKSSELQPGDHITVEARQDDEGFLYAATVTFNKVGTPAERASASRPVRVVAVNPSGDDERPKLHRAGSKPAAAAEDQAEPPESASAAPLPPSEPEHVEQERVVIPVVEAKEPIDDSDPGVPHIRRGRPVERKPEPETREVAMNTSPKLPPASPTVTPSAPRIPPPSAPQTDPRIEKARAAAMNFTSTLPSYVCKEQIARFQSTTHKVDWQPIDIVSAEVVYEDGREHYRNLEIDGKPVKKQMEQLSGAWSTGEFGTVLVDLFSPATDAQFRYRGERRIAGRDAYVFNFEVDRENSHWHVQIASQSIEPSYKGGIWVDKETSRVLRIEMEATAIPEAFPADKIESATDYQFTRIGDAQFLLPVHSEVLSCERGTSNCSRNTIDFRNYHKFEGESTIKFEDKPQ